jgi:hypothetical protein
VSLIKTPFGFASTAAEVAAGVDLTGRRAVVTGGASGIGVETARALAGAGAEVTLALSDHRCLITAARVSGRPRASRPVPASRRSHAVPGWGGGAAGRPG